jgi:hypothetical protein
MPRIAVARGSWTSIVVALSAALAVACDGGERPAVAPDAGPPPADDAGMDAAVEDAGTDAGTNSGGPPWPTWDGSVPEALCVLRLTAQCDGPEDCGSGRACCARFEPTDVSYTATECADECDFQSTFPLCHAGGVCTADGQLECRTSLLIPHDFIGICAPRSPLARKPTGEAVAGKIDCGAHQCVFGEEQCCLREGLDLRLFRPVKYEPYCAPIGEPCDCSDVDIPPPDAGIHDAGIPDAGIPDAGIPDAGIPDAGTSDEDAG